MHNYYQCQDYLQIYFIYFFLAFFSLVIALGLYWYLLLFSEYVKSILILRCVFLNWDSRCRVMLRVERILFVVIRIFLANIVNTLDKINTILKNFSKMYLFKA